MTVHFLSTPSLLVPCDVTHSSSEDARHQHGRRSDDEEAETQDEAGTIAVDGHRQEEEG